MCVCVLFTTKTMQPTPIVTQKYGPCENCPVAAHVTYTQGTCAVHETTPVFAELCAVLLCVLHFDASDILAMVEPTYM